MKFSLFFFAVAVLLGGVVSDFLCIVMQLTLITPDRFFSHPYSVCRDIKQRFEGVRRDLKTCTRHKINVDELESLHNEYCQRDSEFRQNFTRNQQCLSDNVSNVRRCLETMSFNARTNMMLGSTVRHMCMKLAEDTCHCLNEQIGKPCGDGGLKVYKRITEASKPFFAGICLEAAGVAAEDDAYVNEADEVEVSSEPSRVFSVYKDAEVAVAEAVDVEVGYTTAHAVEAAVTEAVTAGTRYTTGKIAEADVAKIVASAATKSSYLLSLLLGVLIALKFRG